jgi:AraC family transcriptional regulator, transcriptional activator FtrA
MNRARYKARAAVRRIAVGVGYTLVLVGLPLAFGLGTALHKNRSMMQSPPAFADVRPAAAPVERGRLTAVVVAGHAGTESTDLLAPYEVLMATGEFEVYTVARERRPVLLFPGTLDLLPHYSYADYDRLIGRAPDLLVIPYIVGSAAEDPSLWQWIRDHAGENTTILTICGGSLVLAEAGLLAGRPATSHQSVLRLVRNSHPDVEWISGERWVDDGNIISSAGITSGIDATLHAVGRLLGREKALEVARILNYPHVRYLDDPRFEVPQREGLASYLSAGFRWRRTDIGVLLSNGVDEIELASLIDTYPRSFTAQVHTVAPSRRVVRSRHGLELVPRTDLATAPALDRVLLPGGSVGSDAAEVEAWAAARGLQVERMQGGGFAYDVALRDMARVESTRLAASAAHGLEYPMPELKDAGGLPLGLLFRPVGLGLLGVLAVFGAGRARRRL